jgi:hypothetical protein
VVVRHGDGWDLRLGHSLLSLQAFTGTNRRSF